MPLISLQLGFLLQLNISLFHSDNVKLEQQTHTSSHRKHITFIAFPPFAARECYFYHITSA